MTMTRTLALILLLTASASGCSQHPAPMEIVQHCGNVVISGCDFTKREVQTAPGADRCTITGLDAHCPEDRKATPYALAPPGILHNCGAIDCTVRGHVLVPGAKP